MTLTTLVGPIRVFTLDSDELEMSWYRLLRRHVARQINHFKETEPAQRRFRGRVWWNAGGAGGDGAVAGGKVSAPGADGAGRGNADKGRGRGRGEGKIAGVFFLEECFFLRVFLL